MSAAKLESEQRLLADASARASRLLEELLAEESQLRFDSATIAQRDMAEGRAAVAAAIDATRRTIEALERAASVRE